MDLNILWFILIGVLFTGYFILEGFDFGVGILLPFLGKDDRRRRLMINTIGPHWDGNEVWLITAGGAIFAAFPEWYATLFSGFYLPLFLMLVALILRGVAFEFRSKDENPRWRQVWDICIFVGSLVPALLWGVALANLVRGVPINQDFTYVGGFFNLLNWYALLAGLTSLVGFTLHGAIFLSLKTSDDLAQDARKWAMRLWIPTIVLLFALIGASYLETNILDALGVNPGVIPFTAVVTILLAGYFLRIGRSGWAFVMSTLTIAFVTVTTFLVLYPSVMVSSLDPAWSLTIYNASSSPYTLRVMSIVALIFVPIVLAYQGWSYWVFRKRLTAKSELEY
ncbi:MAG: cytochrome d ubiquinol oxidase subunit II [Anaerolineales bacterium]|nr:cytochrome d ubiquinol oxidase subunit II [Anaerolineales bacterium]